MTSRNFFDVCDQIVEELVVINNADLTNANQLLIKLRFPADLRECVLEFLFDALNKDQMNHTEADDFLHTIEKIKRSIYYLPPEDSTIVWEKLSRACYNHLEVFSHTPWA